MIVHQTGFSSARSNLQRQWLLFAITCLVILVGGYLALQRALSGQSALRWVVLTALVMGYQVWLLWTSLDENQRFEEIELLPNLGWGNAFSLLRGIFFAGLTGFLFSERLSGLLAWLPGLLYTLGALIDFVDGYAARVTNHVTRLGEKLDMSLDGWGMLVATGLAVQYGQAPAWYLLVGMARYLFLFGLWIYKRQDKLIYELPPMVSRRGIAGLQMGFSFVILWPLFSPPGTHIVALIFSIPLLAGFLRDWLVVSGVVQADDLAVFNGLQRFSTSWLPLVLRLGIVVILAGQVVQDYESLLDSGSLGFSGQTALLVFDLLVGTMIAFGAAGRVMAITGLILLGFHQMAVPLSALQVLLAWFLGGVMYLGTGLFSSWKPEDNLIYRRAGE